MELTDMKGEIKVKKIELYDGEIYTADMRLLL